ncbi:MlaA family lipoprotein [Candidatus Pelagibacter sp. FZCC0015]|uniref:MlaA family lipoprotein n=1 Tax=Candidatus Pelagibacter sp. FZCC0015 TaxID=2268451 RepID=UPI0011A9CA4D|nr:VacJ family lipoprotein [Candidatus Pelagibacter sp. FZCC0015]
MYKKLVITILLTFFAFNANAGSDGDLALKASEPEKINDCFEKLNRATFAFNQGLDKTVIKPIAKGYKNLPDPIQKGTSNAVKNLSALITIPNNLLQGDIKTAIINTARLAVNTTIGVLGTIDVANKMGFPKYEKEDYGQTLAVWGVGSGCYLVLPVLGPSTLRDTAGSFANVLGGDPWYNASTHGNNEFLSERLYLTSKALSGIDFRANNIESFENLETNSIDFYASVKSLYLQDRENKINNNQRGNIEVLYKDENDWEEIDNK